MQIWGLQTIVSFLTFTSYLKFVFCSQKLASDGPSRRSASWRDPPMSTAEYCTCILLDKRFMISSDEVIYCVIVDGICNS